MRSSAIFQSSFWVRQGIVLLGLALVTPCLTAKGRFYKNFGHTFPEKKKQKIFMFDK